MSYNIILGSIMGVSLLGVIIAAKKQSRYSIAKPLVAVFSLIILVCTVVLAVHRLAPPSIDKIVNDRLIFIKSSGYRLGGYLSKQKTGSQILLLADSAERDSPACKAVIEGLKEGIEGSGKELIVLSPPHSVFSKDEKFAQSECVISSKDFNRILNRYSRSHMLVSLIGLPSDIQKLNILQKFIASPSNPPRVALLNCKVENMYKLMKGGFIGAVVFPNPKTKYNDDVPVEDLTKNFDMRFLFVTKDNMDQIAKDFPGRVFSRSVLTPKKK